MAAVGRRTGLTRVAALDGSRGLAVAGVLLFHGGHLRGGYLGVDFFFTLSGFLITSLLLAESKRTGGVGLGGFWARRARRLLPALAVLMIGVAVYCIVFADRSELTQIRGDAFATIGYVANWHQIFAKQSYFALFSAPSPLTHTWSLAIEEQFYVVWPLLFVVLLARFKQATPKAVLVASLALAAVSSVLMIALYDPSNTNRVYFGTDTRAAAILFGAALAAWFAVRGPTASHRARIALETGGIVGAIVLAVAWTRLDGQSSTLYRGGFLVCGLAATAVIAAAVHPQRGALSRVLSFKPLCLLGLISYGVYLYHWPIDVMLDEQRVGFGGWPLFALQAAVTLAIAIVSYHLIEQPIRHGALSSAQLRKLTPAISIAIVVAIFVATLGAQPALVDNLAHRPIQAASQAYRTAAPGARRIMVVGNSVGYFLAKGMQAAPSNPPSVVFDAAVAGCVFPSDVTKKRHNKSEGAPYVSAAIPCHPAVEADVVSHFRPQVVFWVMSDPYPGDLLHDGQWLGPCSAGYHALFVQDLRREIERLRADGARVVITTAAYGRYALHGPDAATDCDNQLRRSVAAATHTQLIDLFTYVCGNGGQCRSKEEGATLRPDGLHYEGAGAVVVARWLLAQVH